MRHLKECRRLISIISRHMSTKEKILTTAAVSQKQNELFDQEKRRQLDMVKRIEKITVHHVGQSHNCKLAMNKNLSTPYHVAMHFNETYTKRSAIALVNGKPWHMLQPLTEDCELRLVNMKDDDPKEANEAFWRSCSFMAGAILLNAFKTDVYIQPVRAADIPVSQGCFAYDVNLPFPWDPSQEELTSLSRLAYELAEKKEPFERLEVRPSIAMDIFQDNEYKVAELNSMTADRIVLFRLGQFIDVSPGPLVTNSGFMVPHRYSFTCVHHIEDHLKPGNKLTRFQGVALPSDFPCHYHTWNLIQGRAETPVTTDASSPLIDS
ncbi:39S ribosomal protein L39, mitochondrial-like [Lytechinus variegatus]|uniref:39S ribosomal protein L39, mitochondrial-like n=1 Tax=Lytechinus variegatus TaxID=7654 RepID=UPI001BB0DE6D|nr:39S ribosomal protein L39, mitochondrial-like [Lytechinus variegatus]